ncbi:MAG: zinc dependent phospholipase C family protein [Firmicutes bacterium]|nr:zinc dependent phospholipase C family protein [Bacillota bacterium]
MKTQGHLYLANLILKELEAGKYEFLFKIGNTLYPQAIDSNIRFFLLNNKQAFRAGAIGPDVYFDIYFGQAIIHPKGDINSGLWLMIMQEELKHINLHSIEGQKAYAFFMGFLVHYATDMYTHTYVNDIAGGAFPAFSSLLFSGTKRDIVRRHISLESYIDSKIPSSELSGDNIELEAPADFVINCFIKYPKMHFEEIKKRLQGTPEYNLYITSSDLKYNFSSPFADMYKFREKIMSFAQKLKPYRNNPLTYVAATNVGSYCEYWVDDIDRAIYQWIKVSDKIAYYLTAPYNSKTMDNAKEAIETWAKKYLAKATPIPDVIIDFINAIPEIPLIKELVKPIEKLMNEFLKLIVNIFMKIFFGLDINDVKDMFNNPEKVLNSDLFKTGKNTTAVIDKDLGNFGKEKDTTKQTFKPFSDALNMAKLCLLGADNLNCILHDNNEPFNGSLTEEKFDKLHVTIKTKNKTFAGTDDDVFFGVKFKNGKSYSVLCDIPFKNDFEKGSTGKYTLELPYYFKVTDVDEFFIQKKHIHLSLGPDWYCEWVEVKSKDFDFGRKEINKDIKNQTPIRFKPVNALINYTYNFSIDPKIVTFIKSIDESNEVKNAFYYNYEMYKCIFEPENTSGSSSSSGINTGTGKPEPKLYDYTIEIPEEKVAGKLVLVKPSIIHLAGCSKVKNKQTAVLGKFKSHNEALAFAKAKYPSAELCLTCCNKIGFINGFVPGFERDFLANLNELKNPRNAQRLKDFFNTNAIKELNGQTITTSDQYIKNLEKISVKDKINIDKKTLDTFKAKI